MQTSASSPQVYNQYAILQTSNIYQSDVLGSSKYPTHGPYSKKKCSPVAKTSIPSPTLITPSSNGVTCIPKHADLLPSSTTLYFRIVVPGSLRSAMPVVGSTLGSLQRVVRHEMSRVRGPIFAYVDKLR